MTESRGRGRKRWHLLACNHYAYGQPIPSTGEGPRDGYLPCSVCSPEQIRPVVRRLGVNETI